jgi:hypothetical protein
MCNLATGNGDSSKMARKFLVQLKTNKQKSIGLKLSSAGCHKNSTTGYIEPNKHFDVIHVQFLINLTLYPINDLETGK